VRAAKALYDYSTAYRIPLTSGKDSMKNDFKYTENGKDVRISIPLTLLYSGVCKIEDYRRCVTIDVKKPGDIVYVLGITRKELGGSEYYNLHGALGNIVPKLDASCATRLYRSLGKAMDHSLVESCHDCSDGGLGVALAESAFSGGYGMELDLSKVPQEGITRNDELMFSESQSRFVATVRPQNREMFEKMMGGNIFSEIGTVTEDASFRMKKLDGTIESTDLRKLKEAWQKPLRFDLPLEDAR
jgi:phosphoribosylformylglycinamidine synthase